MKIFFVLSLFLFPSLSWAGLFKIVNRDYGSGGAYQAELDQVFDALETAVNALLPISDNASFMTSMANNATLSGASNMGNYGSSFRTFEAGIHAGVSIQSPQAPSGAELSLNTIGGFGAQATVRLGLRPKMFFGDEF